MHALVLMKSIKHTHHTHRKRERENAVLNSLVPIFRFHFGKKQKKGDEKKHRFDLYARTRHGLEQRKLLPPKTTICDLIRPRRDDDDECSNKDKHK